MYAPPGPAALAASGGSPADVAERTRRILGDVTDLPGFIVCCQDLHRHPEQSGTETLTSTAGRRQLTEVGARVVSGIGGTGVGGNLANGGGPVVMLWADMDALPVQVRTGLDYASTVVTEDADGLGNPGEAARRDRSHCHG